LDPGGVQKARRRVRIHALHPRYIHYLDNLIRFGGLFPTIAVHAGVRQTKLLGTMINPSELWLKRDHKHDLVTVTVARLRRCHNTYGEKMNTSCKPDAIIDIDEGLCINCDAYNRLIDTGARR